MSSFSFTIQIDPAELKTLIAGGFVFAASKASTGGGTPTQWIATPLFAPQIQISWVDQYSMYFTETAIQNGAQIQQTSPIPPNTFPVATGNAYKYSEGSFAPDPSRTAPTGTVVCANDEPIPGNFCLAQSATVNGVTTTEPLLIMEVLNNGSGSWTPLETITFGFSNTITSPGCVGYSASSQQTITLTSGVNQTWFYGSNGQWNPVASAITQFKTASSFWKFALTLSASVLVTSFQSWLSAKAGSSYTVQVQSQQGTTFTVTVNGLADPTATINALQGQTVSQSVSSRGKGSVYTVTTAVTVVSVVDNPLSLEQLLWNRLNSI